MWWGAEARVQLFACVCVCVWSVYRTLCVENSLKATRVFVCLLVWKRKQNTNRCVFPVRLDCVCLYSQSRSRTHTHTHTNKHTHTHTQTNTHTHTNTHTQWTHSNSYLFVFGHMCCIYACSPYTHTHKRTHPLIHSPSSAWVKETQQVWVKPTEPHHTSQHGVLLRRWPQLKIEPGSGYFRSSFPPTTGVDHN